jgi:hypothetical protein
VSNDSENGEDSSGRARICTTVTGSRIPSCVWVDANGNGDVRDNDLTQAQAQSLGHDFAQFIAANNGRNIGSDGAVVSDATGEYSDQTNMARAVSEFIGAASGQGAAAWHGHAIFVTNNEGMSIARYGWSGAQMGYSGAGDFGYADVANSGGGIYLNAQSGWAGAWFDHPSFIARAILHEINHFRGEFAGANGSNQAHQRLDARARWLLGVYGLAGGGCPAVGGWGPFPPTFPSC